MATPDPYALQDHGEVLLELAADAVRHAVDRGDVMPVDQNNYPNPLQSNGATFVTLKKLGELRGCIGSLQAREPLVMNIAENAHGAVARDTRFPTVKTDELEDIDVSISVLSPLSKISYSSESHLLSQLQPGVDGLVLADENGRRSTFLPQVWDELPESEDFMRALKRKGGFDLGPLTDGVKAWRYEVWDIGPMAVIHS